MTILGFALAATLGAASRHFLALGLDRVSFPYGIFLANILGSVAFGWAMSWVSQGRLEDPYKILLMTAFLGSFTTFASFSGAAVEFLQSGQWGAFGTYVLVTNIACIGGCWCGFIVFPRWIG